MKLSIAGVTSTISRFFQQKGPTEPDAAAVDWKGKKVCEVLHEDAKIRILRCTFAPGEKHLRHCHPRAFIYAISGGKSEIVTAAGTAPSGLVTDTYKLNPPIPWHEVTNVGDTTMRYLLVEMKYE